MTTNTNMPTKHWQTLPPLEIARSHAPTTEYKGKLYIFGGGGPSFQSLNSSIRFDPSTNEWTSLSDMPTLRSGAMAATFEDKIYVIGGGFKQENGTFIFLKTVDIYCPQTDTWTQGPDMIHPHDYPAIAILGGHIYILGGHHPDATLGGPKTDPGFDFCERLDIKTNKWEEIAPLSAPRFALSAVTRNGKILAMGGVAFKPEGFNNFTVIESYDPQTNAWSSDPSFSLPWPAAGLGSAMLNDQLYIFGGYSDDDIHHRTSVYDFTSQTWQACEPMPAPVAAMGVNVCQERIYSVGGWADDGRTPISNVYSFGING